MKVTVLMPVYNMAEYVGQAIASVMMQTFHDFELLILDDGSDEATRWALQDHMWLTRGKDARVSIVRFETTLDERAATVRYATLVNWGAANSTGEYLLCLPGDDYLLPDALERMVGELDGSASVVYGAQRLVWAENAFATGLRLAEEPLADAWHRVDMSQVMLRRSAFDAVGGWQDTPPSEDLWRCADGYFWRKLTGAGYLFEPVAGGPVSVKRYRADSVDERVKAGLTPW